MQDQENQKIADAQNKQVELDTNKPAIESRPIVFTSEEESNKTTRSKKRKTTIGIATGIVGAFVVLPAILTIIFILFLNDSISNSGIGIAVWLMLFNFVIFLATLVGIPVAYIKYSESYPRLANTIAIIIWVAAIAGIALYGIVAVKTLREMSIKNKLSFDVYTPPPEVYKPSQFSTSVSTKIDVETQYVEKVFKTTFSDNKPSGYGDFDVYEFPVTKEYNPPEDCGSYNATIRVLRNPCTLVESDNANPIYYAEEGRSIVVYSVIGSTVITLRVASKKDIPNAVDALKAMLKNTSYSP